MISISSSSTKKRSDFNLLNRVLSTLQVRLIDYEQILRNTKCAHLCLSYLVLTANTMNRELRNSLDMLFRVVPWVNTNMFYNGHGSQVNSSEYFFVHLSVCVLTITVHGSKPFYNTAIKFRGLFHDGNTILETKTLKTYVHTLKKVDDQTNDVLQMSL